jgi:hypothetical protein
MTNPHAKSGHYTFNPVTPTFSSNVVTGTPDANGSVENEVNTKFKAAVQAFGQEGNEQKKYANFYLGTYKSKDQVRDVGNFKSLDSGQVAAVAHGTSQARFINVISLPAMDANNNPVGDATAYPGPNAANQGGVTFAIPMSLWNKKKAEFQYNLSKGADGTQTGTGGMSGT